MSGGHRYEPAQDVAGRVRWTCTCGRVGHWDRCADPAALWRAHLPRWGGSLHVAIARREREAVGHGR